MRRKIIKAGVVALVAVGVAAGTGIASASDHPFPGIRRQPPRPSAPQQPQNQCNAGGTSQIPGDGTATVTAWATGCTGAVAITLRSGETTKVFHDGNRHTLTAAGDSTSFEVKINGQVVAAGQNG